VHRARRHLREQLAPLAPTPRPTPKEEKPMIEMRLEDVIVRVAEDDPTKLVARGMLQRRPRRTPSSPIRPATLHVPDVWPAG
jgi:hypothetical protein